MGLTHKYSSFADKEIKTESFPIDLTRELSFNYEDIIKLERNYDRALVHPPLVLELPNNLVKTIACHSCNTIHVQNLKKTMYMLASKTTDEVLLRSTGLPIVTKKKDKVMFDGSIYFHNNILKLRVKIFSGVTNAPHKFVVLLFSL